MTETLKDSLRALEANDLRMLLTASPITRTVLSAAAAAILKTFQKGSLDFPATQAALAVLAEKRDSKLQTVSGFQEKNLNEGLSTVYSATAMVTKTMVGEEKALVSRVPVPCIAMADPNQSGVRLGSDLLATFCAAMVKWSKGAFLASMDYNNLARRKFTNMLNPMSLYALMKLLDEYGLQKGLDPKTGMSGRDLAHHLMLRFQKLEAGHYAVIHTHVSTMVFGVCQILTVPPQGPNGTVTYKLRCNEGLSKCFVGVSGANAYFPMSVYWREPLPRSCLMAYPTNSPSVVEVYNAISESLTLRGGPSSPTGSLLLSLGSWGFPSQGRVELEQDISLIMGIPSNVSVHGMSDGQAAFIAASAQYYQHQYKLEFIVPPLRVVYNGTRDFVTVESATEGYIQYYRSPSPLATTVSKKKNVEIANAYDNVAIARSCSGHVEKLADVFRLKKQHFLIVAPYVPEDTSALRLSSIRAPYDGLCLAHDFEGLTLAVSMDAKVLTFVPCPVYKPAGWRTLVNQCVNGVLGFFLGSINFSNFGQANLVRPLTGKAKRYVVWETFDENGQTTVEYVEETSSANVVEKVRKENRDGDKAEEMEGSLGAGEDGDVVDSMF